MIETPFALQSNLTRMCLHTMIGHRSTLPCLAMCCVAKKGEPGSVSLLDNPAFFWQALCIDTPPRPQTGHIQYNEDFFTQV